MKDKWTILKKLFLGSLVGWLVFFFMEKIDLVISDLGRYLQNGQQMFNGNWANLLHTNFYSYTFPQFFFLNHHWGTGIIFNLFQTNLGFAGLHLFVISIVITTFLLFFQLAKKEANFGTAFLLSLILIPLIAYRNEIRPEILSYFFVSIFIFILWKHRKGEITAKWLWLLPVLEIFWINLHIYFILGIAIVSAFLLEKVIIYIKDRRQSLIPFFFVWGGVLSATFINPFGWRGVLHPFDIYSNYGYRVLEEQSVWFLNGVGISSPSFILFQIVLLLLSSSFVWVFMKDRKRFCWVNFFLATGFSFMACWSVRNIALFAFVSLPILAQNVKIIFPRLIFDKLKKKILAIGSGLVMVFSLLLLYGYNLPLAQGTFGLGVTEDQDKAIEFIKTNQIQGPIFNNYDIGGYLIYYLFPQERVFVDNRPETYPANFFQDVYIPMQEDNLVWQEKSAEYQINTIVFYWHDATPWGQQFLANRINDEIWVPVFVDEKIIIFIKNNSVNQQVIEQYQLPQSLFRFTEN